MGDEAYDEVDIDTSDGRTLCIRVGVRDEVWLGICRSRDDLPDDIVEVDGYALQRALDSMVIGVGADARATASQRSVADYLRRWLDSMDATAQSVDTRYQLARAVIREAERALRDGEVLP